MILPLPKYGYVVSQNLSIIEAKYRLTIYPILPILILGDIHQGGLMAFKIKKAAVSTSLQKRLSLPGDLWAAVELVAKRDDVDENEVVRQALAHALRGELKEVQKGKDDAKT
jgi:hypothetical protein